MPALRSLQRKIVAKIMIFVIKSYPIMTHILCHIRLCLARHSKLSWQSVITLFCHDKAVHRPLVWFHAHPIITCPPSVEYPQAVTACQEKIYNSTTSNDSHLTTRGGGRVGLLAPACLLDGICFSVFLFVYWTMPVCRIVCLFVRACLSVCGVSTSRLQQLGNKLVRIPPPSPCLPFRSWPPLSSWWWCWWCCCSCCCCWRWW